MQNPFVVAAQTAMLKGKQVKPTWIQVGENVVKGTVYPILRHVSVIGRSKYTPHQGKKECARRLA
jgi:hypothetical protein